MIYTILSSSYVFSEICSMLWIFLVCFLSLSLLERAFPHSSHLNFLATLSSSVSLHIRSWFLMQEILEFIPQLEHLTNLFSPCIFFMCFFRVIFSTNLAHTLHTVVSFSFASASWLFLWYFNTYLLLKDLRQTLQDNTSVVFVSSESSEWVSMCDFRIYLFAKDFEQMLQSALSIVFSELSLCNFM